MYLLCFYMMDEEKTACLRLSLVDGLGPKTFQKIMDGFDSAMAFLKNKSAKDVNESYKDYFKNIRRKCYEIDIEQFVKKLENLDIKYVSYKEQTYPHWLKQINYPPIVIYYKGNYKAIDFGRCISIVGTRANTDYGRRMIKKLIGPLVEAGLCIVSGMAFGIDKLAHEETLRCKGKTIAVLASSVDKPSPSNNVEIYKKILKQGLVVSEYPPGVSPTAGLFPVRNRIIAGISLATVVIEAGESSGALITGNSAFNNSRLLYATPGSAFQQMSVGCNNLIKYEQAKLITCAEDIINDIKHMFPPRIDGGADGEFSSLPNLERMLMKKISREPMSEDKLMKLFDISTQDLLASLSRLEIKGLIKSRGDGYYIMTD